MTSTFAKFAGAAGIAAMTAFGSSSDANAGGHEQPKPSTQTGSNTTIGYSPTTNIVNAPTTTVDTNIKNTVNTNAIATGGKAIATGGNATVGDVSSKATVGDVSSKATVGDVTNKQQQDQNQQQQQSISNSGNSTVKSTNQNNNSNGGQSNSQTTVFKSPKVVGNAPAVLVSPGGECGAGVGLSLGTFTFTGGGSFSWQDKTCMDYKAAGNLLGVGAQFGKADVFVLGISTYRELSKNIDRAAHHVAEVSRLSCAKPLMENFSVLASEPGVSEKDCAVVRGHASAAPVKHHYNQRQTVVPTTVHIEQPTKFSCEAAKLICKPM